MSIFIQIRPLRGNCIWNVEIENFFICLILYLENRKKIYLDSKFIPCTAFKCHSSAYSNKTNCRYNNTNAKQRVRVSCTCPKYQDGHADTKKHNCHVCNNVYSQPNQLRFHLWSHTGETPYQCSIWNNNLKRSHHLSRHFKKLIKSSRLRSKMLLNNKQQNMILLKKKFKSSKWEHCYFRWCHHSLFGLNERMTNLQW